MTKRTEGECTSGVMPSVSPNSPLEKILTMRIFEQRGLDPFSKGELSGTTHSCIGQEANAVGISEVLNTDDIVVSNHRGHGHFLAHVGDIDGLLMEIMGRSAGVCGGWGGSQHLFAQESFYSDGVQGGIAPLGIGLALAEKIKGSNRIAVVFLGDGTLGEGAV